MGRLLLVFALLFDDLLKDVLSCRYRRDILMCIYLFLNPRREYMT